MAVRNVRRRSARDLPRRCRPERCRLPFVYEASGTETQFTSGFDPYPRARKIFNFQEPATLARFIRDSVNDPNAPTWRGKVLSMPSFDHYSLRPAQRASIAALEHSLSSGTHSRSLVQMATGAGKTRMAVTEAYRLLQYGGFNRVLFLVDRNNLGDQTLREFRDFTTPDDGRKFSELYNVDKLTSAGLAQSSSVVISTIQRVFAGLRGMEIPEDDDPQIDGYVPPAPVTVETRPPCRRKRLTSSSSMSVTAPFTVFGGGWLSTSTRT